MKEKKVFLVAGLGYGDEGKGSIVDYLVRRENAVAVVRYNGGAQAGHRVVLKDGREHIFSQFGSGSFIPGVQTYLSRFMLVEPLGMLAEAEHLQKIGCGDIFERTVIDGQAPVITPYHIACGRLMEIKRGVKKHSSCGLGIGEAMEDVNFFSNDVLRVKDLLSIDEFHRKLLLIKERKLAKLKKILKKLPDSETIAKNKSVFEKREIIDWFTEGCIEFVKKVTIVNGDYLKNLLEKGVVIFEGAQGMLLDVNCGFYPYVTKTDISYNNAFTLLKEAEYDGQVKKIGVLRGYFTRHGKGPFVTENKYLTKILPDASNKKHEWQGKFRVGYFDAFAAKYAIECIGGVDELALTNLDRLQKMPELKICRSYKMTYEFNKFFPSVKDIKFSNPKLRKKLARLFCLAKPLYEKIKSNNINDYIQKISELLNVKISILSFGPTVEDKKEV